METLPYSMIDMNKKRDLEPQLNILYDKKATGAQIRSRAKWINEGEKNTKFFLGLEKKHQTQNIIRELTNENNDFLNTDEEILGEMCNFYEKLYDTQNINNSDIGNYLRDTNIKRHTDNIKKINATNFQH